MWAILPDKDGSETINPFFPRWNKSTDYVSSSGYTNSEEAQQKLKKKYLTKCRYFSKLFFLQKNIYLLSLITKVNFLEKTEYFLRNHVRQKNLNYKEKFNISPTKYIFHVASNPFLKSIA